MADARLVPAVQDAETTYRNAGGTLADLKGRALGAYFAPDEIRFLPRNVRDGRALALAYLTARAVMDRLDTVLGIDCWRDEYTHLPNGSVMCALSVRFDPEGDWITKSDVGGESEQPDESDRQKAAISDALKRAAVKFGVGRYLYQLPRTWCNYDTKAKEFTSVPTIPAEMLPTAYRPWTREKELKVSGMLEACCDKAKIGREHWPQVAGAILAKYGYTAKNRGMVQGRHADAMIRQLGEWMQEIAREDKEQPSAPIRVADLGKPAEKPKPAQAPAAQQKAAPPKADEPAAKKTANTDGPRLPLNGAELLARLELKDRELSDAGRCKRDELKAYVLAQGAKSMWSMDMTRWGNGAIAKASEWVREFISQLPSPGSVPQDEPNDAPDYAVA